jgi:hypothetical protein
VPKHRMLLRREQNNWHLLKYRLEVEVFVLVFMVWDRDVQPF